MRLRVEDIDSQRIVLHIREPTLRTRYGAKPAWARQERLGTKKEPVFEHEGPLVRGVCDARDAVGEPIGRKRHGLTVNVTAVTVNPHLRGPHPRW
jgi:hypothetical protein